LSIPLAAVSSVASHRPFAAVPATRVIGSCANDAAPGSRQNSVTPATPPLSDALTRNVTRFWALGQ
jgi:hypothetical protein